MTPFHLFIIALCAFGLIIALILACRNSEWEATNEEKELDAFVITQAFDAYNQAIGAQTQALQRAIDEERLNRERQEITQKIDTDALEASLQDEEIEEDSQLEGLIEWALPLIPLTDKEIDAILARPLSEEDEAEIAQAAERAKKRFRDKLNRDNWRIGLNSGSRERIDNGEE